MWGRLIKAIVDVVSHVLVVACMLAGIWFIAHVERWLGHDRKNLFNVIPVSWLLDTLHAMTLVAFGILGLVSLYKIWMDEE